MIQLLLLLLLMAPASLARSLEKIGFVPHIGDQVPLTLAFHDEAGKTVQLADYFARRPVILNLVYYQCPSVCGEVLNGLLRSMRALPIDAGNEFQVITLSFDARETPKLAAAKKKVFLDRYQRKGADKGWVFLSGTEENIKKLTDAVGFEFTYDRDADQFNHPAGIIILTPQGKVSRYFVGIDYPPKDLWLALIDAEGKPIQSPLARFWMWFRIRIEGGSH